MFDQVIACLDGSSLAETILPLARGLASAKNGELTILRVVADEAVGARVGPRIHGPGHGNALVLMAPSSRILHRRQQTGLEHRNHAASNRTARPTCSSEAGTRAASNIGSDVRPMIHQPPGVSSG